MFFGPLIGRQPVLYLVYFIAVGSSFTRVHDARVEHNVQPFVHAPVDVVGLVFHVVHDDRAGWLGLQQLPACRNALLEASVVPEKTRWPVTAVVPEKTRWLVTAVVPEKTKWLVTAVVPEKTRWLVTAVVPEKTRWLVTAVAPEKTRWLATAVVPEKTRWL